LQRRYRGTGTTNRPRNRVVRTAGRTDATACDSPMADETTRMPTVRRWATAQREAPMTDETTRAHGTPVKSGVSAR